MSPPQLPEELLDDVLDGVASPAQIEHFERLLASDPAFLGQCREHLQIIAELESLHFQIRDQSFVRSTIAHAESLAGETEGEFLQLLNQRLGRETRNRRFTIGLITAAAACLTVVLFLHSAPKLPAPKNSAFASIVTFKDGMAASQNREIFDPETINLPDGHAKIRFASGCVISIEGPATLSLRDAMNVELIHGRLNGWCPPSAHGFQLKTGDITVADLGTSFGVNATSRETPEFVVFDGKISIEKSGLIRELKTGDSMRFSKESPFQRTPFAPSDFRESWLLTEGIIATTGDVIPVKPNTRDGIARQRDDQHVLVCPERRQVTTTTPLLVELVAPGSIQVDSTSLPRFPVKSSPGETLNSYLLHARALRKIENRLDHVTYSGSVTFDSPVVGIAITHASLIQSDQHFSTEEWKLANKPSAMRGMEPNTEIGINDVVTLSENRRTVTVFFQTGYGIDELRVITADPLPIQP